MIWAKFRYVIFCDLLFAFLRYNVIYLGVFF